MPLNRRRAVAAAYIARTSRRMRRQTQLFGTLVVCVFIFLTFVLLHPNRKNPSHFQSTLETTSRPLAQPLPPSASTSHPIHQLIGKAGKEFDELRARQSQSLEAAVQEYRRRYKIPPPPNFDKWYEFAKERGVQLIDEYDNIYGSLLPFWALKPPVIRERAREALGFDNALLGVLIRDGRVISAAGGSEWQQKATNGMMKSFVKFLPDMDIPFNTHDEPRVAIPCEDLSRLVAKAKDESMPAAFKVQTPKNAWSPRPTDVDDGTRFNEYKSTRFNVFAHQPTWTHSRASCSPDSPARGLEDDLIDDPVPFSFSELGFISNTTAFSDICLSPSLRHRFGFFNRPNAFKIVQDLFPIFSQSKISSFQDILYPSPWYWSEKVAYEESQDYDWENKQDKMYWRGSTTGGFSRDGGWRQQHRQLIVGKINDLGTAHVYSNDSNNDTSPPSWTIKGASRPAYADLFDVKFSHVGQCDPEDCSAQKEFFTIAQPAKQQQAWKYKYLLDMDGNAFSGRFYAFLKSKSLIYKMAIFREWHAEWLRPWVHYIPLGMAGEEYIEAVRFFKEEAGGEVLAKRLAEGSSEWAGKVLRNEDLECWLFRLLLEYVHSPFAFSPTFVLVKDLGANALIFYETDMDALWTMIEQRLGTTAKSIWAFHKDRYLFITFTHIHIFVCISMIYIHLEMEFRLPTPLTSNYHLGMEIFISEVKATIPG